MYRTSKAALLLGVTVILALTGCGRLTPKGVFPPNNPPEVFFANIPVDSTTFSINPILYWYGTDNDGTIEQYQYSVKRDTVIAEYLAAKGITGTASLPELFIQHAPDEEFDWVTIWVDSVQTSTRDQIRLYASFDTNYVVLVDETCDPPCTTYLIDCEIDSVDFKVIDGDMIVVKDTLNCISESIQQYMFIRAIDDDDSASTIKYRQYLRNNHWPQTKIENAIEFSAKVYFNSSSPTVTYPGIPITWTGSDSADYPRQQPDFEYWWRVFGPFTDSAEAAAVADTVLVDTALANSLLVYDSGDSLTADGWVRREMEEWTTSNATEFIDLWRKEPPSATSREGYFLFEVRTRDDAFAEDPTPSRVTFKAIDAKKERPILFIDDVNYRGNQEPLSPMGSGIDGQIDETLLRNKIFTVLREATENWPEPVEMDENSDDYYRRANGYGAGYPQTDIPLELLARYRLVLIVDDDASTPVDVAEKARLAEYMNIGGNVWIFGRNSLLVGSANPHAITEPWVYPAGPFADFYFDAEGLYLVIWSRQAYKYVSGQYVFTEGIDDFIGAMPTGAAMDDDFPALAVDTNLTQDFFVPPGVRTLVGIEDFRFYTIPDANFIEKGTAAEAVYTYVSRYAGAAFPHDKVCAIRYVGPSQFNPVFKSALFAFSPYAIQHDQIVEVFRLMLAWFEGDSA